MHCRYSALLLLSLLVLSTNAFTVRLTPLHQDRSITLSAKGFGSDSDSKLSPPSNMGAQLNWCPTLAKVTDLPTLDGTIGLIDTNLPTLKNGATNPTGAVSVAKSNGNTYCFGVNCPQCKIPLIKAMLLNDPPRVACTFCKSTYDLKSGTKVEVAAEVSGGVFGGLVKSLFSAQDGGPLPIYKLGEKGGKVVIALD
jgi:nitrite reductase/ring-hydroxylating ferredoxin subunit